MFKTVSTKNLENVQENFDEKFKFIEEKILHLEKKSEVWLRKSYSEIQNRPVKIETPKFDGKQH